MSPATEIGKPYALSTLLAQLRNRYKIRIPAPLPLVAWLTCLFCCRSGVRLALASKLPIASLIPSLGFHEKIPSSLL